MGSVHNSLGYKMTLIDTDLSTVLKTIDVDETVPFTGSFKAIGVTVPPWGYETFMSPQGSVDVTASMNVKVKPKADTNSNWNNSPNVTDDTNSWWFNEPYELH